MNIPLQSHGNLYALAFEKILEHSFGDLYSFSCITEDTDVSDTDTLILRHIQTLMSSAEAWYMAVIPVHLKGA